MYYDCKRDTVTIFKNLNFRKVSSRWIFSCKIFHKTFYLTKNLIMTQGIYLLHPAFTYFFSFNGVALSFENFSWLRIKEYYRGNLSISTRVEEVRLKTGCPFVIDIDYYCRVRVNSHSPRNGSSRCVELARCHIFGIPNRSSNSQPSSDRVV